MIRANLHLIFGCVVSLWTLCLAQGAFGQSLTFATVERPPFSIGRSDQDGFSIELMDLIAARTGHDVTYVTLDSFSDMLARVETGEVDGAIANISITAARESVIDFSLPIFESGLQVMVAESSRLPLWRQVLTPEIVLYIVVAALFLFGGGMLMWVFERHRQPYFERPVDEALFPSFWWALNLVVNGGFEERMPRSVFGRILGVLMVIASLFIVSVFVAKITAALTVTALTSTVQGLNDLDTRRVGTVVSSTAADFLDSRSVLYRSYAGFNEMIDAFEADELDALVFDGPLLRYYLNQNPREDVGLLDRVFRVEDYGVALPAGSELREPINQAILTMRENGDYGRLVTKWFGK